MHIGFLFHPERMVSRRFHRGSQRRHGWDSRYLLTGHKRILSEEIPALLSHRQDRFSVTQPRQTVLSLSTLYMESLRYEKWHTCNKQTKWETMIAIFKTTRLIYCIWMLLYLYQFIYAHEPQWPFASIKYCIVKGLYYNNKQINTSWGKNDRDDVTRRDSRHRSPTDDMDAKYTLSPEIRYGLVI